MRIVKPYGDSFTDHENKERVLRDRSPKKAEHKLSEFALTHNELVISQWISVIDKIATKPNGKNGPTDAQRALREKLGQASWEKIIADGRLKADQVEMKYLHELWNFKIHPYGNQEFRVGKTYPDPKGRWYASLVGNVDVDKIDPKKVADVISKHLYESAYRIKAGAPQKRKGLIESRAESISKNILTMRDSISQNKWADDLVSQYIKNGDVAKLIYERAVEEEKSGKRVGMSLAAEILFENWGKIFIDKKTNRVCGIQEAREQYPELFNLHMDVKKAYTRILKNHRKDRKEHREKNPNGVRVSALLPKDIHSLLGLRGSQIKNAELGDLVRLGKVIHYTHSTALRDHAENTNHKWSGDVSDSPYWLSVGQAEIKRNEAFIRVWKNTISYAALTLKSWADMKSPPQGDILLSAAAEQAGGKNNFDRPLFDKKFNLLFGEVFTTPPLTDADCKSLLKSSIHAVAYLRHKSFHFVGRGAFLKVMEELGGIKNEKQILRYAEQAWNADIEKNSAVVRAQIEAVQAHCFYAQDNIQSFIDLISGEDFAEGIPLPRFSRLLTRRENAWGQDKEIMLPSSPSRERLQSPAYVAKYTLLKMVYERSFPLWLQGLSGDQLSGWFDKSIERTTKAARDLNKSQIIQARAAGLSRPQSGADIRHFFFDLAAATASEMRVQRGYESDGEKAREQAEFINDLLCDVLINGFSEYIKAPNMNWIAALSDDTILPDRPVTDLDQIRYPEAKSQADDWQKMLYFVFHLVPVEEIVKLQHQLQKWMVVSAIDTKLPDAEKKLYQKLQRVFCLYRDMHDQKFDGSSPIKIGTEFQDLYESQTGFERVFPTQSGTDPDLHIPQRGLREILRFGHLPIVKKLVSEKIKDSDIDAILSMEEKGDDGVSLIEKNQKERECLHKKWVENKRLSAEDKKAYCVALAAVTQHRHGSSHIRLGDCVRAHRLMMSVFSRLVDFSGLFERDLYFVLLALLYRNKIRPDSFFNDDDLTLLGEGQILKSLSRCTDVHNIKGEIEKYFGKVSDENDPTRKIRNDLAHLEILKGENINLTDWVQKTRQLMSYDRKLKNAVSKSVIELLDREGLTLEWDMKDVSGQHSLCNPALRTRCAQHLGKTKFSVGDKKHDIKEALHGRSYLTMVSNLFDGATVREDKGEISCLDLSSVKWENPNKSSHGHKNGGKDNQKRPEGRKNDRARRKILHR